MRLFDLRYSRGRIALDLVVAYGAIAVFGVLSLKLYHPLERGAEPQHILVPAIPNGESRSLIVSNGACVGTVHTNLIVEESPSLETVVTLRTTFNGENAETIVRFSAHFNPLHQLGRGSASIESKHFSANATATDVTPIRIAVSGRIGTSIRSTVLSVPGPLSLIRNDSNSYRLEYAQLPSSLSGTATRSMLSGVIDKLGLIVDPATDNAARCPATPSDSLDLTPLITTLGPFVRPLLEGPAL